MVVYFALSLTHMGGYSHILEAIWSFVVASKNTNTNFSNKLLYLSGQNILLLVKA